MEFILCLKHETPHAAVPQANCDTVNNYALFHNAKHLPQSQEASEMVEISSGLSFQRVVSSAEGLDVWHTSMPPSHVFTHFAGMLKRR